MPIGCWKDGKMLLHSSIGDREKSRNYSVGHREKWICQSVVRRYYEICQSVKENILKFVSCLREKKSRNLSIYHGKNSAKFIARWRENITKFISLWQNLIVLSKKENSQENCEIFCAGDSHPRYSRGRDFNIFGRESRHLSVCKKPKLLCKITFN